MPLRAWHHPAATDEEEEVSVEAQQLGSVRRPWAKGSKAAVPTLSVIWGKPDCKLSVTVG